MSRFAPYVCACVSEREGKAVPLYVCFVGLRKAYNSVSRDTLWPVHQQCYHLLEELLTIIHVMHDQSTSVIRAYKKTSEEFVVTSGVRQGCVLAPTPSYLFFDAVIQMAIYDHLEEGRGWELYSTLTLSSLVIEGR